jgi:hypothetical protein
LSLPNDIATGVGRGVKVAAHFVETIVQEVDTPWIEVARNELRRGVAVVPGKEAHPGIMLRL